MFKLIETKGRYYKSFVFEMKKVQSKFIHLNYN